MILVLACRKLLEMVLFGAGAAGTNAGKTVREVGAALAKLATKVNSTGVTS
jgi:hypothetical protein